MRRTSRLFEIIQMLRAATRPLTAADIATAVEVTPRTIYRDMASLAAMAVPVEGAAGIGYVMRAGYDLPPLMFSTEEVEALLVALSLLKRTGDRGLLDAARSVQAKLAEILPDRARSPNLPASLYVSGWGAAEPDGADLRMVREAIRAERKLVIRYRDEHGLTTDRMIRPLAVIYYIDAAILAAWCELRDAVRHFRADRILACAASDDSFRGEGDRLRARWLAESGAPV